MGRMGVPIVDAGVVAVPCTLLVHALRHAHGLLQPHPPRPTEFLELLEHDKRKPKHTGFFISKVGQLVLVGRLMGALLSMLAGQVVQRGRSGGGQPLALGVRSFWHAAVGLWSPPVIVLLNCTAYVAPIAGRDRAHGGDAAWV